MVAEAQSFEDADKPYAPPNEPRHPFCTISRDGGCSNSDLRARPTFGWSSHARRKVLPVGAVVLVLAVVTLSLDVDDAGLSRTELVGLEIPSAPDKTKFYEHMLSTVNKSIQKGDQGFLDWSHTRVRNEVYALQKKVKEIITQEYKHHFAMKADIARTRAYLKGDISKAQDQTTSVKSEVGKLAAEMASGMSGLSMAEREMRRRIDAYKRHYDRDLKRIHAILSNQTLELEQDSRDDLEKMYRDQLTKIQDDTNKILDEDRATMKQNDDEAMSKIGDIESTLSRDVASIQGTQSGLASDLQGVTLRQRDHLDQLTRSEHQVKEEVARLSSAMVDVQTHQKTLQATAKANLDQLSHADSQLKSAQFQLDMLEKKLVANQKSLQGESTAVQQKGSDLEAEIKKELQVIQAVKTEVAKFAEENPKFRKEVESDHNEMRKTIDNLRTEIDKVDAVKKQIGELQSLLDSKINDMSSQLDDLSGKQQIQATALGQQGDDMEGIKQRIEALTKDAAALSKSAKDDHDAVSSTVAAMQERLAGLLGLKETLATVQSKMESELSGLAGRLATMHSAHNSTTIEIRAAMAELKASLDRQVEAETGHYTAADASLHSMEKDMDDLKSYKADAEKEEKELVTQLQDTTQSLGILDAKFGGKAVDLHSEVEELRSAISKVPTKRDFNASLQRAVDKAEHTAGLLHALTTKVGRIRDDQDRDSNALAGIAVDAQGQGEHIDEEWKNVKGTLAGEGEVLSKMAHKLHDDDLAADVDRVFQRAPAA